MAELPKINIITAGHVDHGKSTLVGRLLYDSGAIRDDQLRKLKEHAISYSLGCSHLDR